VVSFLLVNYIYKFRLLDVCTRRLKLGTVEAYMCITMLEVYKHKQKPVREHVMP
jgi:hypothetical protein